jgi:NADP-dependent aldehyde dehydrogenase
MSDRGTAATDAGALDRLLDAAGAAARPWAEQRPGARAACLRAVAARLEEGADELVAVAGAETNLSVPRLVGELGRTTFQLRLFADVLDEGAFLGATIDGADPDWPPAPRPDLRRMMVGLGPVVVFAAGNFPFAFSVAGGDTAAALAAGCPVVVKAHPGHLRLSALTGAMVEDALRAQGAPAGTFAVIYGEEAGRRAVVSDRICAGAFTGSLAGGRALFDLAVGRPVPIPFYAEMGSLNPVFVTGAALADRSEEILSGWATSFTLSGGQFCTKPGLLFVPARTVSDEALVAALAPHRSGTVLLSEDIERRYGATLSALEGQAGVRVVVAGDRGDGTGPGPTVLATSVAELLAAGDELLVECFGPTSLVVAYENEEELLAAAAALAGQLTAVVHGQESDGVVPSLLALLADRCGRVIWNGWPTGVSVTAAMQHGGPYPATTGARDTSVGTAAIDRFLRPLCYQSVPEALLPEALRHDNPLGIPRRVNGRVEGG